MRWMFGSNRMMVPGFPLVLAATCSDDGVPANSGPGSTSTDGGGDETAVTDDPSITLTTGPIEIGPAETNVTDPSDTSGADSGTGSDASGSGWNTVRPAISGRSGRLRGPSPEAHLDEQPPTSLERVDSWSMRVSLCSRVCLACAVLFADGCYAPHGPMVASDDGASGGPTLSSGPTLGATLDMGTADSSTSEGGSSAVTAADDTSSASSGGLAECGNGVVETGEVCDDATNDGAYGGCQPGCGALAPHCGDGTINSGEACDDGDAVNGNGCNVDCLVSGTQLWSQGFAGAAGGNDRGEGIAADSSGNVIAVGTQATEGFFEGWIRAYDLDGNAIWTQTQGSTDGDLQFRDVTVLDEDPVVAGFATVASQGLNSLVVRFDFDGATVWSNSYDSSDTQSQTASGVASQAEGFLGVALSDNLDIRIRRLDAEGGEMWSDLVAGPGGGNDVASDVAMDGDGNIVATGITSQPEGLRAWLRKYSPNGQPIWTRILDEDLGVAGGRDVAVDPMGSVFISTYGLGGGDAVTLVRKYDVDGGMQWTSDGSIAGEQLNAVIGIAADSVGDLAVLGLTGETQQGIVVAKYDGSGVGMWAASEPGLLGSAVSSKRGSVAVDPWDHILVITSIEFAAGNDDIWMARYTP